MTSKSPRKKSKEKKKRYKLKGQHEIINQTYNIRDYDGHNEEETEDEF